MLLRAFSYHSAFSRHSVCLPTISVIPKFQLPSLSWPFSDQPPLSWASDFYIQLPWISHRYLKLNMFETKLLSIPWNMVFLLFSLFQVIELLSCWNPRSRKHPYFSFSFKMTDGFLTQWSYFGNLSYQHTLHTYKVMMCKIIHCSMFWNNSRLETIQMAVATDWIKVWDINTLKHCDVAVKCLRKLSMHWKYCKDMMLNEKARNGTGHVCYFLCNKEEQIVIYYLYLHKQTLKDA